MNTLDVTIRKEIAIKVLLEPAKSSEQKLIEEIGKTIVFLAQCSKN